MEAYLQAIGVGLEADKEKKLEAAKGRDRWRQSQIVELEARIIELKQDLTTSAQEQNKMQEELAVIRAARGLDAKDVVSQSIDYKKLAELEAQAPHAYGTPEERAKIFHQMIADGAQDPAKIESWFFSGGPDDIRFLYSWESREMGSDWDWFHQKFPVGTQQVHSIWK